MVNKNILLRLVVFLTTSFLIFNSQTVISKDKKIVVGSKTFVESYVLGEIAKEQLERGGVSTQHKKGMGGTLIMWQAIINGSIDAYPEYTGTINEIILRQKDLSIEEIRSKLSEFGLGVTDDIGFDNTYAFAMREELADKLSITKISDLKKHPDLKVAFTHEFLKRTDGWEPLSRRYNLNLKNVKGLEHNLAYKAISTGKIDLMDAFSTDFKIESLNLRTLEDDLKFFPEYKAVYIYRKDISPKAINLLKELEKTIDSEKMIELNAVADNTKSYTQAAAKYFGESEVKSNDLLINEFKWIREHLSMVFISMLIAILLGIPLGVFCSKPGLLSELILGITGIIQTIPSLALLAMLVPVLGISLKTAIAALFFYSLLPIVKNTSSGLKGISQGLRDSAEVLGLSKWSQLTKIYIPLSSRTILAGIRTSAIINIGTATLAALIGAGGLGEPIVSGLYLNDNNLILQGAIPAALLAIVAQWLFNIAEQFLIPRGLKSKI
ncbi:MAG: glycine betaine ABC transporter substrate-binding protein [Candidatus Caenarcaniphilales bacterium]|nr:glycine betaine ABC transporter substrate-binding protein [Candidatus Caenarcaniphilales bacterium]